MIIMMQEVHCPAAGGLSTSHGYRIFYACQEEKKARVAIAVRADARVKVHVVHAHSLMTIVDLSVAGRRLRVASLYIPHETSPVNWEEAASTLEQEIYKDGVLVIAGDMNFSGTEAMQETLVGERWHRDDATASMKIQEQATQMDYRTRGAKDVSYNLIPASKRPVMPTDQDILEANIEWLCGERRRTGPQRGISRNAATWRRNIEVKILEMPAEPAPTMTTRPRSRARIRRAPRGQRAAM